MDAMPQMSDEEIALRVQAGESDRFAELVARYQAKLMRYAHKFLSDPDDAEDIVQDVFIKAYSNIQSFDTSRRFSPWIYRIAHNEFVNELKKKASRRIIPGFDIDTLLPHLQAPERADTTALAEDLRRTLETHLDQLDAKYREPLILYYLEEMDYKEISDILQIPISTVGVRLARARSQLQKVAGDSLYE